MNSCRLQKRASLSDQGPDGKGHQLVKARRTNRREFKCIALSGYGMESDIRQSLDAGFHADLTKPVNIQALEKILSQTSISNPEQTG